MELNDIKFLPKANAFADVYGKATGIPFIGEMMVAAAGNGGEPVPPQPESDYLLLLGGYEPSYYDEDGDCKTSPVVYCNFLSKENVSESTVSYGWTGGSDCNDFPYDGCEDCDNYMGCEATIVLTQDNYQEFDVGAEYIGWYYNEFTTNDSYWPTLCDCDCFGDAGEGQATYSFYVNGDKIGEVVADCTTEVDCEICGIDCSQERCADWEGAYASEEECLCSECGECGDEENEQEE